MFSHRKGISVACHSLLFLVFLTTFSFVRAQLMHIISVTLLHLSTFTATRVSKLMQACDLLEPEKSFLRYSGFETTSTQNANCFLQFRGDIDPRNSFSWDQVIFINPRIIQSFKKCLFYVRHVHDIIAVISRQQYAH